VLLAAVAGALRAYWGAKGDNTDGVEVRTLIPVNLRPSTVSTDGKLGNQFGIVALSLPVGEADAAARVREVQHRMIALKTGPEAMVTLGLFAGLGHTPQVVQDQLFDLLLSRATAVMTNVPGPQRALTLAGTPIRQIVFWVPQSGSIGMGVSILTYNGHVQFGLVTDAALVPDPEQIIGRFGAEFEKLLLHVLMSPWGSDAAGTRDPASRLTPPPGTDPRVST